MNTELEEMGPVDYMVIEFPGGQMSGKGLPLLVDLVDRGTIRILDLLFFRKLADCSVSRTSTLPPRSSTRGAWRGSSSTKIAGRRPWRRPFGAAGRSWLRVAASRCRQSSRHSTPRKRRPHKRSTQGGEGTCQDWCERLAEQQ